MTAPVFIGGHSLGAARAALYAFSRVQRGLPVAGVYLFGCPSPGDQAVAAALSGVPVTSVRNLRDPVTAVPFDVRVLGEDYDPAAAFTEVRADPPPNDAWGLLRDHHIELYVQGCAALARTQAPIDLADAVGMTAELYNTADGWDWTHFVDGQYWAMKKVPSGARLLIARGSTTVIDWLDDFDFTQQRKYGARVSAGFWAGVGPIETVLDGALADG